jgi:RsmE family RNA methyltransferase
MAKSRFYIPAERWNPEHLVLDEEEAHHCLDVMRCREGDRVIVFDGAGSEAEAEIVATAKGSVTVKATLFGTTPRPTTSITLGQAVPKGKNMDLIIQKATELGASRLVPLLSERTVVQLDGEDLDKKRQKWQRVAIEACKQCGQNWVPEVAAPVKVEAFARSVKDRTGVPFAQVPPRRPRGGRGPASRRRDRDDRTRGRLHPGGGRHGPVPRIPPPLPRSHHPPQRDRRDPCPEHPWT